MLQRGHGPEQRLQQRHREVVDDERRCLARPQHAPPQQQVGVPRPQGQLLKLEALGILVGPGGDCLVEAVVTPLPIGTLEVEFDARGAARAAKGLHVAANLPFEVLQTGEGAGSRGVGRLSLGKAVEEPLMHGRLVKQRIAEVL